MCGEFLFPKSKTSLQSLLYPHPSEETSSTTHLKYLTKRQVHVQVRTLNDPVYHH